MPLGVPSVHSKERVYFTGTRGLQSGLRSDGSCFYQPGRTDIRRLLDNRQINVNSFYF